MKLKWWSLLLTLVINKKQQFPYLSIFLSYTALFICLEQHGTWTTAGTLSTCLF